MKTRIISVINQKGGTGKTTTTINLAAAIQAMGKQVLLIDLDPQANLTYSLGIPEPEKTIANLLDGTATVADVVVEREGMHVVPGTTDLVDIEVSLAQQENRHAFLKEGHGNLKKYSYIFIDCPPSLSVLTLNALVASNEVLIPLQMEVLTLQGLSQILATVNKVRQAFNPDLRVAGIAVVMYDRRRKLSQEVENILQENIPERVFENKIRINVKLAEAPSFGKSVHAYDPNSAGAHDYQQLASEFLYG